METAPVTWQALVNAFVGAAHGDLMRVKGLLAGQSGLINARASWGETALGAAAHTAQEDIAEFLLSVGAPLDLCTATMLGRTAHVAQVLRANPDLVMARGAHDLPVLYYAAIRGHRDLAALLLRHGADVNAGGGAALHGAVSFDQPALVEWLLANGARADGGTAGTPLAVALERGLVGIADLLRRHGAVEAAPAPR